jgi:hypothetical protein
MRYSRLLHVSLTHGGANSFIIQASFPSAPHWVGKHRYEQSKHIANDVNSTGYMTRCDEIGYMIHKNFYFTNLRGIYNSNLKLTWIINDHLPSHVFFSGLWQLECTRQAQQTRQHYAGMRRNLIRDSWMSVANRAIRSNHEATLIYAQQCVVRIW